MSKSALRNVACVICTNAGVVESGGVLPACHLRLSSFALGVVICWDAAPHFLEICNRPISYARRHVTAVGLGGSFFHSISLGICCCLRLQFRVVLLWFMHQHAARVQSDSPRLGPFFTCYPSYAYSVVFSIGLTAGWVSETFTSLFPRTCC